MKLEEIPKPQRILLDLLKDSNVGLVVADSDGIIRYWNRGAKVIFGFTEEEAIGEYLTLIMPERYHIAHLRGIERMRQPEAVNAPSTIIGHTNRIEGLRKNGEEFPLLLYVAMFRREDRLSFMGLVIDTTDGSNVSEETIEQIKHMMHKKETS